MCLRRRVPSEYGRIVRGKGLKRTFGRTRKTIFGTLKAAIQGIGRVRYRVGSEIRPSKSSTSADFRSESA
jgi:hypothetical protein